FGHERGVDLHFRVERDIDPPTSLHSRHLLIAGRAAPSWEGRPGTGSRRAAGATCVGESRRTTRFPPPVASCCAGVGGTLTCVRRERGASGGGSGRCLGAPPCGLGSGISRAGRGGRVHPEPPAAGSPGRDGRP